MIFRLFTRCHHLLLLVLVFFSFGGIVVEAGEPLKVFFFGKIRSGTASLAAALKKLGYNPCHGRELIANAVGSQSRLADAFIDLNVSEILQATSDLGCNATMELHADLWRDLIDKLSDDTKFIVVVRPKDAWMKSVTDFYTSTAPLHRFPLQFLPVYKKVSKIFFTLTMKEGGWDSRDKALKAMRNPLAKPSIESLERVYNRFLTDVQDLKQTKPRQTLIFDLQEGYPPLCKFLGVKDCPKEPFPRVNRSSDVRTKYSLPRKHELIVNAVLVAVALAMMVVLGWTWQRQRINKSKTE